MSDKRQIKVFIASPGDLHEERRAFRDQIDQLNLGFGDGANVEFILLGWEGTLATTGRRAQSVINREVDNCDVFILILSRRWGQAAPDSEFSSYTEEEFYRALERFRHVGTPEIFIFFKGVDSDSLADPGPQLQKVIDFKLEMEESRSVLYKEFNDIAGFTSLVSEHMRAYSKGEIFSLEPGTFRTPLPLAARQELQDAQKKLAQAESQIKMAIAKADGHLKKALMAEELALELASVASGMALEGKVEQAKIIFAKAVKGGTSQEVLYRAARFYYRIGSLSEAEGLLAKGLVGSTERNASFFLGGLGDIYAVRGDWNKTEEMYRKILAIDEKLDRPAGVASACGNLGNVFKARGELGQAENMYRRALEIDEKLNDQAGLAREYNNLGIISLVQGSLSRAESLFKKALEINEKLGNEERMADAYGNLGIVFKKRGDLAQAETMHRNALEIDEKLGRLIGIAGEYNNLGLVFQARGDLGQAETMYKESLAVNETLGRPEGIADAYGNLGRIYQSRGDLIQAEEMYCKALKIDEKIGNVEGMASSYLSLGTVCRLRGVRTQAEEMYLKALVIFESLGARSRIKQTQALLRDQNDNWLERITKGRYSLKSKDIS